MRNAGIASLAWFFSLPLFWSSSYYVASSGGAPIDKLRKYIKEQDVPTE